MPRYLIEDEDGMLVSVPAEKLGEYLTKGKAQPDEQLTEEIKRRLTGKSRSVTSELKTQQPGQK